jgi:hypothetical protein
MANELYKFGVKMSDFSGLTDDDFKTRYIKPPKSKEIPEHRLKYDLAIDLARDIKPEAGCRYFVILDGKFIAGDFIEAFVTEHNIHVRKMTISTLSLSENNVDSLANLLDGGFVDELNLIVSDFFFSHERRNLIPYLYEQLDKDDKFQLGVAGTHCKTCLIETHDGRYFIIHGSANLRSSANIEQIVIEEGRELYDFNLEYQEAIMKKYKTINKAVRHETLWAVVKS